MNAFKTYLWKEWHQNRTLAFCALGVFLGISFLPVLADFLQGANGWRSSEVVEGVSVLGGPILAVVLGVYAMSREQGSIQGFWQSRPISIVAWILSKYIIGLCILIGVCGITIGSHAVFIWIAQLTERNDLGVFKMLACVYVWYVLVIYSAAFVLGAWIRGTMHALILSIGAVALIFLVPMIIPWLNRWSLTFMMQMTPGETTGYFSFVIGLVLLCAAMVGLCYMCVRQQKQINVDQKVIAWSTVVILLVLGATALFPIGNNLTAQQILDLPVEQEGIVNAISTQGNQALVLLSDGPDRDTLKGRRFGVVQITGNEQGVSMGEPTWFLDSRGEQFYWGIYGFKGSQVNPSVAYFLVTEYRIEDKGHADQSCRLLTLNLDQPSNSIVQDQDLTAILPEEYLFAEMGLDKDHLYIYQIRENPQARLITFSLEDPESPVLVSDEPSSRLGFDGPRPRRNELTEYQILTVPNSNQNLKLTYDVTQRHSWPWAQIQDDHVLGLTQDWMVTLFEKESVDQDRIVLKPISVRPRSAVQKLLTLGYIGLIDTIDNWAVSAENMGVTVFRVNDQDKIERMGHYAVGNGFRAMGILQNKHVLLGNDKLHVLKLDE